MKEKQSKQELQKQNRWNPRLASATILGRFACLGSVFPPVKWGGKIRVTSKISSHSEVYDLRSIVKKKKDGLVNFTDESIK